MEALRETWAALEGYMAEGGFVMPPLVVATLLLWYGLGYRLWALRRGSAGDLRRLVEADRMPRSGVLGRALRVARAITRRQTRPGQISAHDLDALLEEGLMPIRRDLTRFKVLVTAIVMTAPLAGLLGTVSGMIETFDALGDKALFAATGGVAGGISQALLTTQMGLIVAVPGVIVGRLLDRRQRGLEADLDQLRELAVARGRV